LVAWPELLVLSCRSKAEVAAAVSYTVGAALPVAGVEVLDGVAVVAAIGAGKVLAQSVVPWERERVLCVVEEVDVEVGPGTDAGPAGSAVLEAALVVVETAEAAAVAAEVEDDHAGRTD
jgi:hypothetical protein